MASDVCEEMVCAFKRTNWPDVKFSGEIEHSITLDFASALIVKKITKGIILMKIFFLYIKKKATSMVAFQHFAYVPI